MFEQEKTVTIKAREFKSAFMEDNDKWSKTNYLWKLSVEVITSALRNHTTDALSMHLESSVFKYTFICIKILTFDPESGIYLSVG